MLNTVLLTGTMVVLVNQAVIQLEGHIVGYVTLQSVAMEGIIITNHHSGSVGYTTVCAWAGGMFVVD